MLCRALLAAVAISYLICVLLLSGIQKEDLDVSMLQKLHRHNVNINDLNNEGIRKQCLSESTTENVTSSGRSTRELNGDDDRNNTDINVFVETLTEKDFKEKDVAHTLKTNIDQVMQHFNQQKTSKDNIKIEPESNPSKMVVSTEYIKRNKNTDNRPLNVIITTTARPTFMANMDEVMRFFNSQRKILEEKIKFESELNSKKILTTQQYITTTTARPEKVNDKSVNEYDKGKSKLDSVIKFWQMYMNSDIKKIDSRMTEIVTEITEIPKIVSKRIIYQDINPLPLNIQNNMQNFNQENIHGFVDNMANNYNHKYRESNIANNYYLQGIYRDPQNNTNIYVENKYIDSENNPNYNHKIEHRDSENNKNNYNHEYNYRVYENNAKKYDHENYRNLYFENIALNYNPDHKYQDTQNNPTNYHESKYSDSDINVDDNHGIQYRDYKNNRNSYYHEIKNRYPENNSNNDYREIKYRNSESNANNFHENSYREPDSKSNNYHDNKERLLRNNTKNYKTENKYNIEPENNANTYYENKRRDFEHTAKNYYHEHKSNDSENNEFKEIERISKMISNYLSKKRPISAQTKPENKLNVKLSLVSQQLNSFLANKAQSSVKQNIVERDKEYFRSERKKTYPDEIDNFKEKLRMSQDEKVDWPYKTIDKTAKLKSVDIYDDTKEFNGTFTPTEGTCKYNNYQQKSVDRQVKPHKAFYEKATLEKDPKSTEKVTLEKDPNSIEKVTLEKDPKSIEKVTLEKDMKSIKKVTETVLEKTPKHLTPEIIKQIAESVKEIILKDLRREITTTSTTTSATTTAGASSITANVLTTTTLTPTTVIDVKTTTKKLDISKAEKATQAIEKFMDLFEQFKSLIETPDEKYNMTEKVDEKKVYNVPINTIYQAMPQMPAINPYGVRASPFVSPIKQSPMIVNPYVHQSNGYVPQVSKQNKMTPPQHTPVVNMKRLRPAPIMIQTDQNEIPPLVISLSKPSPISHNIVVTSEFPYFINKADRQRWQYMSQYGRSPDTKDEIVNRKESLSAYSNVDYKKHARELGGTKHSGSSDKFEDWEAMFHSHRNDSAHVNYRETPTHSGDDHERNYHDDIPHYLDHYRGHPRDHNIRGFHERLESLDQWPEHKFERIDAKKDQKVAPRQQMPINMKSSNYDDTHFRNFLNTQQKVNHMLEGILAANSRPDGPRSVESI